MLLSVYLIDRWSRRHETKLLFGTLESRVSWCRGYWVYDAASEKAVFQKFLWKPQFDLKVRNYFMDTEDVRFSEPYKLPGSGVCTLNNNRRLVNP